MWKDASSEKISSEKISSLSSLSCCNSALDARFLCGHVHSPTCQSQNSPRLCYPAGSCANLPSVLCSGQSIKTSSSFSSSSPPFVFEEEEEGWGRREGFICGFLLGHCQCVRCQAVNMLIYSFLLLLLLRAVYLCSLILNRPGIRDACGEARTPWTPDRYGIPVMFLI